jgi:hypothetical protein
MSDDDDVFDFPPENLYVVMDKMKGTGSILAACDTQDLCDVYAKMFPMQDDLYQVSCLHMKKLSSAIVNRTMMSLVDSGCVEYFWNEKAEDFSFSLTDKGTERAEKLDEELREE